MLSTRQAFIFIFSFVALVLDSVSSFAATTLRIATWNVETVGGVGTSQYIATQTIIARINPDVIAIAEVASDTDVTSFKTMASSLGYSYTTVAPAGPFGTLRGAIMSKFPIIGAKAWPANQLSSDTTANDLTRFVLEAQIKISDIYSPFSVVTTHWKSGNADSDEFRRDIETYRVRNIALKRQLDQIPFVVMGDMNENVLELSNNGTGARSPTYFTASPTGLPTGFKVGSDISSIMSSGGLYNNPFLNLQYVSRSPSVLLTDMVDAKQLANSYTTRPISGRRIDYIFKSTSIPTPTQRYSQVYNCAEDSWSGGLTLYPSSSIISTTCSSASDHLPVFADISIPDITPSLVSLLAQKTGTGKGTITSSAGEINCGATCSSNYKKGTLVTLTATPLTNYQFTGWSGACSGTAKVCSVLVRGSTTVSATFK